MTAMDQTDKSNQYASQIDEFMAENADLREQVALLKEGLQDFADIRAAVINIASERDVLVRKLEDAVNDSRQIDALKAELDRVVAEVDECELELVAAREEVDELQGSLTIARDKLERSDAITSSLQSQLGAVTEERDEMNDCIESLKKYLHEVVLQNQVSVLSHRQGAINDEDIELCPSSSSDVAFMESSVIICDHKSTMSDMISSFQSMQSIITNIQESHLVSMTHAEITTKEKVNALNEQVVALQAENRKLVESNHRITSEMEERSAEHDHMQLQIDQSTEFLSELRMQLASKTSALDIVN
jgi:chromosome segregation ATPase